MKLELAEFLTKYMKHRSRFVPARLQAALALLEKLRDEPSLNLDDHFSNAGSSSLKSHERYGDRAHERFQLQAINKNHGRRSSNLRDWGQTLLNVLKAAKFAMADAATQNSLVDSVQKELATHLRNILEQEPLIVAVKNRSVEAVILDLLTQAEEKAKTGDVAQYLVAAKLMLRLKIDIPVHPANKADRKSISDLKGRLADVEIKNTNTIFEVAVGLPDSKHIEQIAEALDKSDCEIWLLTRSDRVPTWKNELKDVLSAIELRRVIVTSVESFVGQNISELGGFETKGKVAQMQALFDLYNTRWIAKLGPPGIRIEIK